ncbi:hypothetical protein ACFZDP_40460 [Streptomyces mirabilis]|jgi:hypothetical protein|uniref:hypothetical protein n=1 Tax=Streptomyces mirabilis TaxID=68239 RepID=UPI0006BB2FF9|nr:hypothetical protein OK006_7354 [Actinobacteria bacterium OK006]
MKCDLPGGYQPGARRRIRAADPDQRLITLTAESGIPSHALLRILASWAAQAADHPVADR